MPAGDGHAVSLVRSLLQDQGVVTDVSWRSTVVVNDEGDWVVRTWTRTPSAEARPSGQPQFVHAVHRDPADPEALCADLLWAQ